MTFHTATNLSQAILNMCPALYKKLCKEQKKVH